MEEIASEIDVWRLLQDCPTEALVWAARAYHCGVADGRAALYAELGEAGRDVARAARSVLAWPSHREIAERRGETA